MKNALDKKLFFSMTKDFLEIYIPQDSSSRKTVKTYRDGLTVFRRYVTDERCLSIKDFTFQQCTFDFILDYRNWLLDSQQKAPSTVNNRLAAIRSYLHYAAAKDISLQQIHLNITAVPFLRVPKKMRPVIDDQDTLRALLDAPPNTRTGCRDTMLLSVLFDTMIRVDELIRLELKDVKIDVDSPYLFIHGKGNKERIVPLSDKVIPLIREYLKDYDEAKNDKNRPFLYTKSHDTIHHMSERNVERIVKKYADLVRKDFPDLPDSVYPHMFRRSRGTGMYRDGVPIEAIATAMGHASIQTTRDHYAFPSLEQKRQAMEQGNGVIASQKEEKEWPDDENEIARLCGLR